MITITPNRPNSPGMKFTIRLLGVAAARELGAAECETGVLINFGGGAVYEYTRFAFRLAQFTHRHHAE